MIHIYTGDGKGKTTAAVGLCVRAAGSGMRVLFVQFFKDGSSSEIKALSSLDGVDVLIPSVHFGRCNGMSEEQKNETRVCYGEVIGEISRLCEDYGMIILDESVSAYRYGMIDALPDFLAREGQKREIVLTGRGAEQELVSLADYVSEINAVKHPFEKGITARKGIEY